MVFQGAMNALNPVKTVRSQIVEPMELHHVAEGADAVRRAGELLELVGIPASAGRRYPHEFSGGMRQRAAIAFLGLGDPSAISWGLLIENAFSRDAVSIGAWWAIVPPGVAVAIVVVSLTMLGTAIEDALNPRLRVSHVSVRRFRLRPAPRAEDDA